MDTKIKKIGVFTSGGDSPGMNAAIRAVTRSAIYHGIEVVGFYRGYDGLIQGDYVDLTVSSVANQIHRGGTFLKSARSADFREKEGRKKAFDTYQKLQLDGLVVIGGDGSFTGAKIFADEFGVAVIGVPGTIDNDLFGTDYTIGYDTALNTVVEAVDKIRDTAESHNRIFFVEVMGRDAGFIALRSAIAGGAVDALVPEYHSDEMEFIQKLDKGIERDRKSMIVIVAEGEGHGGAIEMVNIVKKHRPEYDAKVTILGHIQRGGNPSSLDRVLASRLGEAAVRGLMEGKSQVMAGVLHRDVVYTPFEQAIKHNKGLNEDLVRLLEVLSI